MNQRHGLELGTSHNPGVSESERQANSRAATDYTLEQALHDPAFSWQDLNPENASERDKALLEQAKKHWQEFATSVAFRINKQGIRELGTVPDLDAKCSLGLLGLAGLPTKNLELIPASQTAPGKVHTDTGDKQGAHYDSTNNTLVFDHHAPTSPADTSATEIVYQTLRDLGWLEKSESLDRLVAFINDEDNKNNPKDAEYFKTSAKRLYGIARFLEFKTLYKLFEKGQDPYQILNEEYIKTLDEEEQKKIGTARYLQNKIVQTSVERIENLDKHGFSLMSKTFGRILVDIGKTVPAGYSAARGAKKPYDVYINWSPLSNSFFISSAKGFPPAFEPKQGIVVRGHMWLKPLSNDLPLQLTLDEILKVFQPEKLPDRREPLGAYIKEENAGRIQYPKL